MRHLPGRPRATIAAALAGALAPLVLLPQGVEAARPMCHGQRATIVGTAGVDLIVGTGGRDVVVAGGGDDVIRGRGGDDVICAGGGDDRVFGGRGSDRLFGQGDGDLLIGGPGDDRLFGGADRFISNDDGTNDYADEGIGDVLEGRGGDDLLSPGFDPGTDDIYGWSPYDGVSYRHARGPIRVDLRAARRTGRGVARGEGTDIIVWHAGFAVTGSPRADTIDGSPWHEVFFTGGGRDRIRGHGGHDAIDPTM